MEFNFLGSDGTRASFDVDFVAVVRAESAESSSESSESLPRSTPSDKAVFLRTPMTPLQFDSPHKHFCAFRLRRYKSAK